MREGGRPQPRVWGWVGVMGGWGGGLVPSSLLPQACFTFVTDNGPSVGTLAK